MSDFLKPLSSRSPKQWLIVAILVIDGWVAQISATTCTSVASIIAIAALLLLLSLFVYCLYFKIFKMEKNKKKSLSQHLCHAKCPECGEQVPFSTIKKYFLHGTSYYTTCPHCGLQIHPAKEPVKTYTCFCLGGMSIMIPMYSYWYFVAWDFIPALLFALPFVIAMVTIVAILIIRNIKFSS